MAKKFFLKTLIILTLSQALLTVSRPAQPSPTPATEEAELAAARSRTLAETYGWRVEGQWTAEELKPLLKAAAHLEEYVENLTGADGQAWIQENIGDTTFHHATVWNSLLKMHFALPNGDIYLYKEKIYPRNNTFDILHEVAHVLDNRLGTTKMATILGGGPSEQMVADLGGNPDACRIKIACPGDYTEKVAGPESWAEGAYGNHSVADDFAETLSLAVFKPDQTPPTRLEWMNSFIRSTIED